MSKYTDEEARELIRQMVEQAISDAIFTMPDYLIDKMRDSTKQLDNDDSPQPDLIIEK